MVIWLVETEFFIGSDERGHPMFRKLPRLDLGWFETFDAAQSACAGLEKTQPVAVVKASV